MKFADAHRKYGQGLSYREFLQQELETQLDIIAESSRGAHHLVGPLSLAAKLAEELVETP